MLMMTGQLQSSRLDWKNILRRKLEKLDIDKLRIHCRTGRPLGTDKFISKLETVIGRRLRALPVGRPKKKEKKKKSKRPLYSRLNHFSRSLR